MLASAPKTLNSRTARPVPLTAMGFGGAPLGNMFRAITEAEAQATLEAAHEAGIGYFDTAPFYGLGRSEERFGTALARWGLPQPVLSTKIGRILEDCAPGEEMPQNFVDVPQRRYRWDYTYDGVMRSYEDSRRRLGGARIDMLLVHDIDAESQGSEALAETSIRQLFDGGGHRALSELRSAGEVAAIGAGLNLWEVCERLLRAADFDCFLLAGRYTLLEQEALESFLPLCLQRDVGIILGGPYNSGILATGPVAGAKYNYTDAPKPVLDRVARIETVCAAHGVRLIEAALQFPTHHPAVKTVIPGAMAPAEVVANVGIFAAEIPVSLWSDLKSEGLIRPDAPVPGEG